MKERMFYKMFKDVEIGDFFLLPKDESGYIKISDDEAIKATMLSTGRVDKDNIEDFSYFIGAEVRTYRWKF